jgi:hypothetical protein
MSRACFETPGDGLADVIQGLGLRASLGDAARNGRALCNQNASLIGLQRHEQLHTWILLHLAPDDGVPDIGGALVVDRPRVGYAHNSEV